MSVDPLLRHWRAAGIGAARTYCLKYTYIPNVYINECITNLLLDSSTAPLETSSQASLKTGPAPLVTSVPASPTAEGPDSQDAAPLVTSVPSSPTRDPSPLVTRGRTYPIKYEVSMSFMDDVLMSRLNHTFVTLAFCLWEWVAAHCIQSKIICFERAAKCYSVAVWSLCGLWVATLSGQTVLHVCDLSFLSVRMSCSSLYTGRNYLFWTSCKVLLCGLVECLWIVSCNSFFWQTVLHTCDFGFLSVRMSCSSLYTVTNYLLWTSCKVLLCGRVKSLWIVSCNSFWTDSTTRLWP